MRNLRQFWPVGVLVAAALLPACGGGSSSPSPVTTTTTLPPRDGRVVLNGTVGGKFQFSSTPAKLSRSFFGCGDATITVPYRETAGGSAVGADYEVRVLDITGFTSRDVGKATNITINPNSTGTITFTERFICVEYTDAKPPQGQVALNFGGTASGGVSQLAGTGDLTLAF